MVGSIVLVKVYFTDLSEYKIRPVYLFKKYDDEDYLFLPLSSNLNRIGVIITGKDIINGNIDKDSVVLIPKIGIIHKSLILKKIGALNDNKVGEILKELCCNLGC